MITTHLTPGSPCWLDLGVPDVPAAAQGLGLPAEHGSVEGRGGRYVGDAEVEPAGGAGGEVGGDPGMPLVVLGYGAVVQNPASQINA
ncbi:hypothetical protein PV351_42935, partial [Streptomyces scabiei]|nr:hypothetical protein [Streptomyces scabiei]